LALYVWACWQRPWGGRVALLGLVAPSTLAAVFYTETSLLVAALMIGGCRLVGRRPVLAGVLFGLLAFKPQFGVLIPVALVSARQWRSVIAAGATVVLSVIASGMIFGWATWARLPGALADVSRLVAGLPRVTQFSPTVTAGLRMLGAGPLLTDVVQFGAAAIAAIAVWLCFHRGVTALAAAALMVGAFLATPYAFFYDLTLVSYAVLAIVIERHRSRDSFATWEILVLILAIALPLLFLFNPLRVPWGIVVLPLLFGLILRRSARTGDPVMAVPGCHCCSDAGAMRSTSSHRAGSPSA
ncbi:MAG: glycosyltransferase family 87 protein, partial [Acetobacteraceae bacterium]